VVKTTIAIAMYVYQS